METVIFDTDWAIFHQQVSSAIREGIEQAMPSLRDQFAMAALTGMMAEGGADTFEGDAINAYMAADAMLKAREVEADGP